MKRYRGIAALVLAASGAVIVVGSSLAVAGQLAASPAPTKDPREFSTGPNLVIGPNVSLPPKETVGPAPTRAPFASRSPGIAETGLAPLPSEFYTIKNQWLGVESGHYVVVYAGALTQQPSQGMVVVQAMSFDLLSRSEPQVFTAPQASGPLRVTAFSGLSLTLTSSSGGTFTFDVGTRQFR